VVFCGVRHDVEKLLKASDIYVQTASHFEGFCIAAFEAAASGLPVIYPESDGLALLKSFGHPYEPGDQAGLAAAIREVSGDEPLKQELVRKGTAAANRMSVEFTRSEYARLYEELLDTARAAAQRTES
jgi:glycosyltransferase involved in cell wall biosynthesis